MKVIYKIIALVVLVGGALLLSQGLSDIREIETAEDLRMKKWIWTESSKFGLTFNSDGQLDIDTDCNNMSSTYTVEGERLILGRISTTLMACNNSREGEFSASLIKTERYTFTSSGELVLHLSDGSSLMFR
ncbi:MAG: META domain-containing protein [Patescibacteria group bacterium]